MYPGAYTQPLMRKSFVQCPVIAGYVTARLRAGDIQYQPAISGDPNTAMTLVINNVSNSPVWLLLQSTTEAISGERLEQSSGIMVVGGGRVVRQLDFKEPYLEIASTQGNGLIRVDIEALRQWEECAFSRTDRFYPAVLYNNKPATPISGDDPDFVPAL